MVIIASTVLKLCNFKQLEGGLKRPLSPALDRVKENRSNRGFESFLDDRL